MKFLVNLIMLLAFGNVSIGSNYILITFCAVVLVFKTVLDQLQVIVMEKKRLTERYQELIRVRMT